MRNLLTDGLSTAEITLAIGDLPNSFLMHIKI